MNLSQHDFGIALGDGSVATIITQGDAVPSSRAVKRRFLTATPEQAGVRLVIYQFDPSVPANKTYVGALEMALNQPVSEGTEVEIEMSLDRECTLDVCVRSAGQTAKRRFPTKSLDVPASQTVGDESQLCRLTAEEARRRPLRTSLAVANALTFALAQCGPWLSPEWRLLLRRQRQRISQGCAVAADSPDCDAASHSAWKMLTDLPVPIPDLIRAYAWAQERSSQNASALHVLRELDAIVAAAQALAQSGRFSTSDQSRFDHRLEPIREWLKREQATRLKAEA